MSFTVNTNVGAMAALQSLSTTNKALSQTQSRINSGYNVASTKDDSASYAFGEPARRANWHRPQPETLRAEQMGPECRAE